MERMSDAMQEAVTQLERGNIAGGTAIVKREAAAGVIDGMYALGMLYRNGVGVERSSTTARQWFIKAADGGSTAAMLRLSELYARGDGVESSLERAMALCEQAGTAGELGGYVTLGLIHEQGDYGASPNAALAADYYEKAASGNARGMFHLGRLCLSGIGLHKDTSRGFALIEASAAANDEEALNLLAYLCHTGYQGHPEDRTRAWALYRRAARLGHSGARDALKHFPPVVNLGAIACSPGVAELSPGDRKELIDRHAAGNWGDVDPKEWDCNDQALAAGATVFSVHRAPSITVLIQTDGPRRSSYMEIKDEDFSSGQNVGLIDVLTTMKKTYEWSQFIRKFVNGA